MDQQMSLPAVTRMLKANGQPKFNVFDSVNGIEDALLSHPTFLGPRFKQFV